MKGVYSGAWYLEKERRLRKCERSVREIQRKNEYRSKKAGEDRYGERKRFKGEY